MNDDDDIPRGSGWPDTASLAIVCITLMVLALVCCWGVRR
jgi:hypothetical protein